MAYSLQRLQDREAVIEFSCLVFIMTVFLICLIRRLLIKKLIQTPFQP